MRSWRMDVSKIRFNLSSKKNLPFNLNRLIFGNNNSWHSRPIFCISAELVEDLYQIGFHTVYVNFTMVRLVPRHDVSFHFLSFQRFGFLSNTKRSSQGSSWDLTDFTDSTHLQNVRWAASWGVAVSYCNVPLALCRCYWPGLIQGVHWNHFLTKRKKSPLHIYNFNWREGFLIQSMLPPVTNHSLTNSWF